MGVDILVVIARIIIPCLLIGRFYEVLAFYRVCSVSICFKSCILCVRTDFIVFLLSRIGFFFLLESRSGNPCCLRRGEFFVRGDRVYGMSWPHGCRME